MMRIGHIELFVREPLQSMEFYRDVLGCEVVAVQGEKFVWLSRGPIEILLRPGTGPAPSEQYNRSASGIVLYTDDLGTTAAELTSRGLTFQGTDGSNACLTFTDPDGHWFQRSTRTPIEIRGAGVGIFPPPAATFLNIAAFIIQHFFQEIGMEQETAAPTSVDNTALNGIELVTCYVDDFQKGYEFYNGLLGLEKQYEMGDNACYFKLGETSGLYLEGGNQPAESGVKKARASFVLGVGSAGAFFNKLRAAGVPIVQGEPMSMGNDQFWFQFSDPAGNLLK